MRTATILLCALLLSSTALAQGRGGPDPDPLKDMDHGGAREAAPAKAPPASGAKRTVRKRTVHVVRTHRQAPAKQAPAHPKKTAAPKGRTRPAHSAKASE